MSLLTFLILVLVSLGLPALLLALDVPSFAVGNEVLWIWRWQNTAEGSGISFNLAPLLVMALGVGLGSVVFRDWRPGRHSES